MSMPLPLLRIFIRFTFEMENANQIYLWIRSSQPGKFGNSKISTHYHIKMQSHQCHKS